MLYARRLWESSRRYNQNHTYIFNVTFVSVQVSPSSRNCHRHSSYAQHVMLHVRVRTELGRLMHHHRFVIFHCGKLMADCSGEAAVAAVVINVHVGVRGKGRKYVVHHTPLQCRHNISLVMVAVVVNVYVIVRVCFVVPASLRRVIEK